MSQAQGYYTVRNDDVQSNVNIVTSVQGLPDLSNTRFMHCDVETTGLRPWHGDKICGIALLRDDESVPWYIPLRHEGAWAQANLNPDSAPVRKWMTELMTVHTWANFNVQFDARFFHVAEGIPWRGEVMIDTQVEAKLHDSERIRQLSNGSVQLLGHDLKALARDWCGLGINASKEVATYLSKWNRKEDRRYSKVPIPLLGKYAGGDVLQDRALLKYVLDRRPDEVNFIAEVERKLTPVLFDMSVDGLRIDKGALQMEQATSYMNEVTWTREFIALMGGKIGFKNSHNWLHWFITKQLGLPVLKRKLEKRPDGSVKIGGPEYGAKAMQLYAVHPQVLAKPDVHRALTLVKKLRDEVHFRGLFLNAFDDLMDSQGFIHPTYNQIVRTGRMSSKNPNSQQQNKRSKRLIIPDTEDEAFISADASQIEFRWITHYSNDRKTIEAYRQNPRTDFHSLVADTGKMSRRPAKTINFCIGYGAGDKRVTEELARIKDIAEAVSEEITLMVKAGQVAEAQRDLHFAQMCHARAAELVRWYHTEFPGIKQMSAQASRNCRSRGYSLTFFRRRRHLGTAKAHSAFNAAVQGTAGDFMKLRMIETSPRYCSWSKDRGVRLRGNVHDENLYSAPKEVALDDSQLGVLEGFLEAPVEKARVDMRFDIGQSTNSWYAAAADAGSNPLHLRPH